MKGVFKMEKTLTKTMEDKGREYLNEKLDLAKELAKKNEAFKKLLKSIFNVSDTLRGEDPPLNPKYEEEIIELAVERLKQKIEEVNFEKAQETLSKIDNPRVKKTVEIIKAVFDFLDKIYPWIVIK